MATITGTAGGDIVHSATDGKSQFGYKDLATASDAADTVTLSFGTDISYTYGGNDTVDGGDDGDFIDGGNDADKLIGGAGNDILTGGQGTDNLIGGVGQDLFRFNALSELSGLKETIDGGADFDTLDFVNASLIGPLNLSLATLKDVEVIALGGGMDVTLTAGQLSGFDSIQGTNATERFILSAAGLVDLSGASIQLIDEFRGTGGDDGFSFGNVAAGQAVNGLSGNDSLDGGAGNDLFDGGDGKDLLHGRDGADTLSGGASNDRVFGNAGNDVLIGGAGQDSLDGSTGNDVFVVSLVADVSGLVETIAGGADTDRIDFQSRDAGGAVDLSLAKISDVERIDLSGNVITMTAAQISGVKTWSGSNAYDEIVLAGPGKASFAGDSLFLIDKFTGSSGDDGLDFAGVTVGVLVDSGRGDDKISGGVAADLLLGGDDVDSISGGAGNDTIIGGQGADSLFGGTGYDVFQFAGNSEITKLAETINGGADDDRLDFVSRGASGSVDLSAAKLVDIEELDIQSNVVTLTASQLNGFDTIFGSNASERIVLSAAGIVDLGNADIRLIDEFRGTAGDDGFSFANAPNGQFVNALAGLDTLTGGAGADILSGGADADTLSGGNGDDVLIGGLGFDSMTGGAGADRFVFDDTTESPVAGRDIITDFRHGIDAIDLRDIDAIDNRAGHQSFDFIGGGAFSKTAGELRYSSGVLSADVNGDGKADFAISLANHPTLTATDLLL